VIIIENQGGGNEKHNVGLLVGLAALLYFSVPETAKRPLSRTQLHNDKAANHLVQYQ
jgi:hypothetical protein